jgi:peptidyl-tRNA hydrolase ICT1
MALDSGSRIADAHSSRTPMIDDFTLTMLACRLFTPRLISVTKSAVVRRCLSSSSDDDVSAARSWLNNHGVESIPLQSIGSVSFSRSSGPGGQHVNTTSSKATLRVPLDALLQHVPTALHSEIKRSRYVAAKSKDLIVQSDSSRKQSDNAQSCYKRLYKSIAEAGQQVVPNETSTEQLQHVKNL